MAPTLPRAVLFTAATLCLLLVLIAACGSIDIDIERTTSTPEPDPTPTSAPAAANTPAASTERGDSQAPTRGSYKGLTYVVGEGSKATFTVEEKLASLPLPNDAVVHTTALSGDVNLDGRRSLIKIDLHKLESDQSRRDRYIRERMFPNDPIATFTLPDARPLPEGFAEGEEVTTEITGELEIKGVTAPVTFQIEARDDGDVIYIVGRTSFVWEDFGMTAPRVGSFVQVTDEVTVEILIAARPYWG